MEKLKRIRELARKLNNKELMEAVEAFEQEYVDVRDYCESYHQALCITDRNGVIIYLNPQYARDTGLDPENAIGSIEPFIDPISMKVMEKKKTISFGNTGAAAPTKTGRFVTGVPVFDENHEIRHVVITLAPESEVYRRFRELKKLMNQEQAIRIIESGEEGALSLLGKDPKIKEIRSLIRRVAPTEATVLVVGESGTGKEVVSDCIQELSNRNKAPYVKINCAAIPANMLEAELFGYEKGAFTGASSQKLGLFEVANHGTILLDEIGDFPLELQPKLLRILQQGEMYRIGNNNPVKLDVRVIAATNIDLRKKMLSGQFREDLYYRINVFPIEVPPLRKRQEDIPGLVQYFLQKYCQRYDRVLHMSDEVLNLLQNYEWPGNVRELQNIIEYYVICSEEGKELDKDFLSQILQRGGQNPESYREYNMADQNAEYTLNYAKNRAEIHQTGKNADIPLEFTGEKTLFELRDNYEKLLIEDALGRTSSANKAAKLLGIYPSSLYRKTLKYGIHYHDEEEGE
ncbi:MAG: sigma-54 interaction domain-containing protein [Anaerovoracaceae bacterium]